MQWMTFSEMSTAFENMHLQDVKKNVTDVSKPVVPCFNLPHHSHHNMTIRGLCLHHGKHRKLEKSFTKIHLSSTRKQWMPFIPNNLFTNSCHHISTNGKAPPQVHEKQKLPQFLYSLWQRANARNVSFLYSTLINLFETKFLCQFVYGNETIQFQGSLRLLVVIISFINLKLSSLSVAVIAWDFLV